MRCPATNCAAPWPETFTWSIIGPGPGYVPAAYPPSTARLLWNAYGLPLRTQATSINTPMNRKDRNTERIRLRESLTAEIVSDVEYEINDLDRKSTRLNS